MTALLTVHGGTLAYELTGITGPLVVLAHGMADSRQAYRFAAPLLVAAGYRVAAMDLRGCGESSAAWESYSRTAIAGDVIALVEHLGGPAVLVGHSIAGGAMTIAAAQAPSLVTAVVEIGPCTRKQQVGLGDLRVGGFRRGTLRLAGTVVFGSSRLWKRYLQGAYPGPKPADWEARLTQIEAMLHEPDRMKALQAMGKSSPADAGEQLVQVGRPVLVVQGTLDPDWARPQAEAAAIVAALPAGVGRLHMVPGAGHYPHVQFPSQTVTAIRSFLETVGVVAGDQQPARVDTAGA